jgi:hypothetical protein
VSRNNNLSRSLPLQSEKFRRDPVERILVSFGQSANDIALLGMIGDGKRIRVSDQYVSRCDLIRRLSKICPLCMRERPFLRAVWDLRYWVVCPIHGCEMITDCQACGKPIRWNRNQFDRCCHDLAFSDFQTKLVKPETVNYLRAFAQASGVERVCATRASLALQLWHGGPRSFICRGIRTLLL